MDKRRYQTTHPHLTFQADLRRLPCEFWMLLGEAQSKVEHLAGVPLPPEVQKNLHLIYMAKGAQATTAIEGNSLTEEEVRRRAQNDLPLPQSREYLGVEVDNVLHLFMEVLNNVLTKKASPVETEEICHYHRQILSSLDLADEVVPGKIRDHEVMVANYEGAPAEDCRFLLDKLCSWLNGTNFGSIGGNSIASGIIKAILAHLYLAWIHPFADGNGRTARILEFRILVENGIPSDAAHLLSNHYNQTRDAYYRALDRARRDSSNGVAAFLRYAVQGLVDGLREQIQLVQSFQLHITWRNYVHETINTDTPAGKRRRTLVLALADSPRPVPIDEIPGLSPKTAVQYAGKTSRTLARDLGLLQKEGYVRKSAKGFEAALDVLASFLPARSLPKP